MFWRFFVTTGTCWSQSGEADATNAIDAIAQQLKVQAYRASYGKGQPVDDARALALYRQAAEQGKVSPESLALYLRHVSARQHGAAELSGGQKMAC